MPAGTWSYVSQVDSNGNYLVPNGQTYMPVNGTLSNVPANKTTIPAGTSADTVIRNVPATFYGVVITSTGLGAPLVYDNATTSSGDIVGAIPASQGLGLVPAAYIGIKCSNGIVVKGGSTNPGMTILWG